MYVRKRANMVNSKGTTVFFNPIEAGEIDYLKGDLDEIIPKCPADFSSRAIAVNCDFDGRIKSYDVTDWTKKGIGFIKSYSHTFYPTRGRQRTKLTK